MDIFERRPLGAFAASFYAFACMFFSVGRNARTVVLIIAFAAFLIAVFGKNFFSGRGVGGAVLALSAGMLTASIFAGVVVDVKLVRFENESYENVPMTGVVQSVIYRSSYSGCYTVKPYNEITSAGEVKLLLYCDDGELSVGDRIRCAVNAYPLERTDEYKYSLYADGVILSADAVGDVELLGRSADIETRLSLLREELSSRFTSEMSEKSGGFSAALLLGDRSELQDSISRDFKSLGISHILALSGTHLTVLFALVGKFIPDKGKLRIFRFFLMTFGVLCYMALTGFSASVVRSGIMFIIATAADLINREADSFTSLSAAVLVICILNPYAPFDTGLQLSYVSVMGLLISEKIGRRAAENGTVRARILGKVIPAFLVPSVILPLSWLRFGGVSLASPLANLIFVPVITVLIPVLAVMLILSFVPAVFVPLAGMMDTVISFLLGIAETAAGALDLMLPLKGTVTAVSVIVFTAVLLGAVLTKGQCRKVLGCTSVIVLSCTLLTAQIYDYSEKRGTSAYYVSTGTDDAVFMVSNGYTVLVDIGRYPSATMKSADISVGYSSVIDALVLTHLHQNHRLTLSELCENYYLKSLWLPVPYSEDADEIFRGLCDEAERRGITVYSYIPGETLTFRECTFTAPSLGWLDDSEHPTVSFSLEYEGGQLIYGGARTDVADVPENSVRIVGSHGHEAEGVLVPYAADTLLSAKCAAQFDSVEDSVTVADKAVISLGASHTVTPIAE